MMNRAEVFQTTKQIIRGGWKWFSRIWIGVTSLVGSLLLVGIGLIILAASQPTTDIGSNQAISQNQIKPGGADVIAVVDITGPIIEDINDPDPLALSPVVTASRRIIPLLEFLEQQSEVKAVILRINSPGGTVVASDDIYRKVRELGEFKPVVSSMGDVAASGGYYIAAGTSKIVAHPATITGSIGVIAQFPELTGLYEKIGVSMQTIKSGEFKDIGSSDRSLTSRERAILQSIVSDSYELFIRAIVDGRGMNEAELRLLADGRIYSGIQAKQVGLVDELGNFDTAIAVAADQADLSNPQVVQYTNQSFWESIFNVTSVTRPLNALSATLPSQHTGLYYLLSL